MFMERMFKVYSKRDVREKAYFGIAEILENLVQVVKGQNMCTTWPGN